MTTVVSVRQAAPAGWSLRGTLSGLVIAAVAFGMGAALGYLVAHEKVPQAAISAAPRPSPTETELALIAPLRGGSPLADYNIDQIEPVDADGTLAIVARKGASTVRLEVALVDTSGSGPSPPATGGAYAVFFALDGAVPADGERLAKALAAVIEANAAVARPSGMRPFRPKNR
jgi:hypothetical protein